MSAIDIDIPTLIPQGTTSPEWLDNESWLTLLNLYNNSTPHFPTYGLLMSYGLVQFSWAVFVPHTPVITKTGKQLVEDCYRAYIANAQ